MQDENSIELSRIDDAKSADLSNSHFVVQDESELNQYYENKDIKIFKDIIFIENKQCMIVKTWEKPQHIHTKDVCFIKTLRIFDNHNHPIQQTLTEQIWSNFPNENLYDTSTLQNESTLYFFKRINKKWGQKKPSAEQELFSYLRLYKFDFMSRKESMVVNTQEFIINELIHSPDGQEADIACYNITFADKFGYVKDKDKKLKELEFLRQQFVIVQEYIMESKDMSPW